MPDTLLDALLWAWKYVDACDARGDSRELPQSEADLIRRDHPELGQWKRATVAAPNQALRAMAEWLGLRGIRRHEWVPYMVWHERYGADQAQAEYPNVLERILKLESEEHCRSFVNHVLRERLFLRPPDGWVRDRRADLPTARQVGQTPRSYDTHWRDVQRRLLEFYERDDPYATIRDFAERLGCSKATVHKAIKDSAKLTGWQARHKASKRSPRASSLTAVPIGNAAQTREPDPSHVAEATDDDDAIFTRLIQDVATPEERAKLHALSADKRRELIDTIRNDPDKGNRILGRRP